MPIIYNDIKHTKSCIIDLRFNGGGYDQIGLDILGYFTKKETFAFTKKARYKNTFTPKQNINIQPNGNYYLGEIYMLTSHQTASACETFLLASMNLQNIFRVGSNTEGILSDVLSKKLPNGWEYGLSNEIYESADSVNYEFIGIPPTHLINYSKDSEIFYRDLYLQLAHKDEAIEKAVELILK